MALDALGIPLDIPWRRIAWTRAMLHRKGTTAPPKWRSSLAVYGYALPLEDTEDDYPNERVVYLKLSSSITGWTPSEEIPGAGALEDDLDPWQTDAWDWIQTSGRMAEYWACLNAIAQIAIYPADDAVADDDYPFFIDFEPKKRELYEAVTETGEVLSASANRLGTQKGLTSTNTLERHAGISAELPVAGGAIGANASATRTTSTQRSELETTDSSTERRETQGRSTQLSQMYQLFNGYHHGTNRAVFAMFPRPHIVSSAAQVSANLIRGARMLEGVQEMFLVAVMPRTLTGLCVEAWIDTAHQPRYGGGPYTGAFVVTRGWVGGCADFDGDGLVTVAPETPPTLPPQIVGEGELDLGPLRDQRPGLWAARGVKQRTQAADTLNLLQAELQHRVLSLASSSRFTPIRFTQSTTFRSVAFAELGGSRVTIDALVTLGYLTAEQRSALSRLGVKTAGELFSIQGDEGEVAAARDRLWKGVLAAIRKQG